MHVSAHARGWPRLGSRVKTSRRRSTTTRRTKAPSGRTLYSMSGEPDPIPLAERKQRAKSKEPTSSFHPSDFSTTELKSIAKGNVPEAYRHTMKRSDVPKSIREKASKELKQRDARSTKSSSQLRAEARKTAEERPWELSLQQYLAIKGAPPGGIMLDVSPTQYARMSKAQKRRLDAKKKQESDTRAFYKKQWEKAILEAYEEGKISKDDLKKSRAHGMSDYDASSVIYNYESRKAKAFKTGAERYRRIRSISEIQKGDKLFHLAYKDVTVVKVSGKSVRVRNAGWKPGESALVKGRLIERGALRYPEKASYKEIGNRRHLGNRTTDKHTAGRLAAEFKSKGKKVEVVQDPEGYWWVTEKRS